MKNIPLFSRKDFVLIAVLLFVAGAIALSGCFAEKGHCATVMHNGETVTVIDLDTAEDCTFSAGGTVIMVKDGAVGFVDSDCPDKTCVRTGMISDGGEAAACVPNKVAVKITDEKKNEVDIVVY